MGDATSATELEVSNDYLQNSDIFIPFFIDTLRKIKEVDLNTNSNHNKEFEIKSAALEKTIYKMTCKIFPHRDKSTRAEFSITNRDGTMVNGERALMVLHYDHKLKEVGGNIYNDTNKPKSGKITQSPVRNIYGVFAPIDDAFCQALSNVWDSRITRKVETEKPTLENKRGRFVANFTNRGFVEKTPPNNLAENIIHLEKEFVRN